MAAIQLDLNPPPRQLRSFGWISLVGFGLLAVLAWQEWALFSFGLGAARGPLAGVFAILGLYAVVAGLVYPPANRPLWVALALLTFPIGFVLSYAIMGLLFFGIITPAGLLLRLVGHDPLERRWDREAASYWVDAREPRSKDAYFKQF
jgi:hypothetical protein